MERRVHTHVYSCCCCAVTKSCPARCNPMYTMYTRLPCLSLSPEVCSDSCPLSQWCYLTISSSITLFSFCLQSVLASGTFPLSWLFASGGQSIGASAPVLPMNIQCWFPLGWTGLISCSSRESQESSPVSQFGSMNSLAFSQTTGSAWAFKGGWCWPTTL